MNFCGNCGARVKEGQKICTQCGHPLNSKRHSDTQSNHNQDTTDRNRSQHDSNQQRSQSKSSNKRFWIILIIIVLILAALFAAYKIISSQLSAKKESETIAHDIRKGKTGDLSKHLQSDGKHLSKTETKAWYRYIKQEDSPSRIADEVETVGKKMTKHNYHQMGVSSGDQNVLNVKRDGKQYGIFKKYAFEVPKQQVTIDPDDSGELKYEYNGNTRKSNLTEENTKTLGSFPLGIYDLKAQQDVDGKKFKGGLSIDMSANEPQAETNFKQKRFTVSIDSSSYDSDSLKLYINGKEQSDFDEYEDEEFGPYSPDDKVEVYATTKVEGKVFKSNTENVSSPSGGDKSTTVELTFDDDAIDEHEDKELDKKLDDDDDDDDSSSSSSSHTSVTRDNVIDKVESYEGHKLDTDEYTYQEPEKHGDTWGFSFTDKDGDLAGSYKIDADDGYVTEYDEDGEEVSSGY